MKKFPKWLKAYIDSWKSGAPGGIGYNPGYPDSNLFKFSPVTYKGKLVGNKDALLITVVWSVIVGIIVMLVVKSGFLSQ